jgi:hypothetical protein
MTSRAIRMSARIRSRVGGAEAALTRANVGGVEAAADKERLGRRILARAK